MKLTNRLNLPEAIVAAVANEEYSRGVADISVTQLISPPRQVALKEKHADELEEDASDRIWSLMGQSIHTILERANRVGIAERRLSITVKGWVISGGMDLYLEEGGKLVDYKTTTMWQFLDGKVPESYVQQLNVYAQILRENGIEVKELEVIAILRDWSKREAQRNAGIPRQQVVVKRIPLWTEEEAKAFILARVEAHQAAKDTLPLCSGEDRWAKPDTYAVMKEGRKSAIRVFESEAEANTLSGVTPGTSVVKRPGESVRCASYCSVAEFCTQYIQERTQNEV